MCQHSLRFSVSVHINKRQIATMDRRHFISLAGGGLLGLGQIRATSAADRDTGHCTKPLYLHEPIETTMNDSFVFPQFLKRGDRAVIVSPSGKVGRHIVNEGKKRLESWGLDVTVSAHACGGYATFSGTQEQRLADLQQALDADDVRLIFCSRGGYGAQHLVGRLDFTRFHASPKWVVGFSDITALHQCLQHDGFASLHAPMLKHLVEEPVGDECSKALHDILFGTAFDGNGQFSYTCEANSLNRTGTAQGTLRGGNLAVSYGLRGTEYDIAPADGTVLFVEDVGEKPHAVERMIYNLRIGGVLERLSGLIFCRFTEYGEYRQLGKDLYGALADAVGDCKCPVCFGFPVGHVKRNLPVIEGARVELAVADNGVKLTFFRR